jgi:hypothetical protein
MSSRPESQQHLTPANMAMIERALVRVGLLYKFRRHSEDESQIAAVMVGEFQRGNDTEDGLLAVFSGNPDTTAIALQIAQMRVSLERWDNEGGKVKSLPELAA